MRKLGWLYSGSGSSQMPRRHLAGRRRYNRLVEPRSHEPTNRSPGCNHSNRVDSLHRVSSDPAILSPETTLWANTSIKPCTSSTRTSKSKACRKPRKQWHRSVLRISPPISWSCRSKTVCRWALQNSKILRVVGGSSQQSGSVAASAPECTARPNA